MSNLIELVKGERRKIKLSVHSKKNDIFVIRNSKVEIFLYGELIKTMNCDIDEHDIVFTLELDEAGNYSMTATYEIADEIIKNKFKVEVR